MKRRFFTTMFVGMIMLFALPLSSFAQTTPSGIFYGINNHQNQGGNFATPPMDQANILKDVGMGIIRHDLGSANGATTLKNYISTIAGTGIKVLPVFTPGLGSSETASYNSSFATAVQITQILKGLVPAFECT